MASLPRTHSQAGSNPYDEQIPGDPGNPTVIQAINQYRDQAEMARRDRLDLNRRNRDVFLGRQDFSYKIPGQSQEFLPKVPMSVEQMTSFVKKSIAGDSDWFSIQVDRDLEKFIYGSQLSALLKIFLNNLWDEGGKTTNISTVISDAVKMGLLESLMILKVHGGVIKKHKFFTEPGELVTGEDGKVSRNSPNLRTEEEEEWRLRIDLVRAEDFYPDPTGNNLYKIHRVERDLHQIVEMAERGIYDEKIVKLMLDQDFKRPEDEKRTERDRNQNEAPNPSFRKRCYLDEFWGTLLNENGTVAYRNVVATVANGKYLIRPPEANPFWHQEDPFVVRPLIRVPHSVWHKALYDSASELNLAINEMFNLILDGGLAAVWGVRQVRLGDLEDPQQVAGGIPQGATLAVKDTLPHNGKVVETVTEGSVPSDAMAVFEFLNREFTQAAMTNELKLGALPAKPVKATEVVEASQSQAVTIDGIVSDVENGFTDELLYKSFLTILQNADSIPENTMKTMLEAKTAMIILRASPEERFALFANRFKMKVHGLSSTLSKARDFQKLMAIMQSVNVNPMLLQEFMMKYSPDKALRAMLRALDINPEDLQMSTEELEQLPQRLNNLPGFAALTNGGKGVLGGEEASSGEPGLQSEVSQEANPATGMPPNA